MHVNRAADLPARLEALGEAAGLGRAAVHSQAAAALSVVVHLRRGPSGRHVAVVAVVQRRGELIEVAAGWRADGGACPAREELAVLLQCPVPG